VTIALLSAAQHWLFTGAFPFSPCSTSAFSNKNAVLCALLFTRRTTKRRQYFQRRRVLPFMALQEDFRVSNVTVCTPCDQCAIDPTFRHLATHTPKYLVDLINASPSCLVPHKLHYDKSLLVKEAFRVHYLDSTELTRILRQEELDEYGALLLKFLSATSVMISSLA
jgi:hypothetical protein